MLISPKNVCIGTLLESISNYSVETMEANLTPPPVQLSSARDYKKTNQSWVMHKFVFIKGLLYYSFSSRPLQEFKRALQ
jgi:hypothetical protein